MSLELPRWEPESVEGDAWFLVFAGGIRLCVDREPLPFLGRWMGRRIRPCRPRGSLPSPGSRPRGSETPRTPKVREDRDLTYQQAARRPVDRSIGLVL